MAFELTIVVVIDKQQSFDSKYCCLDCHLLLVCSVPMFLFLFLFLTLPSTFFLIFLSFLSLITLRSFESASLGRQRRRRLAAVGQRARLRARRAVGQADLRSRWRPARARLGPLQERGSGGWCSASQEGELVHLRGGEGGQRGRLAM